MSFTGFIGVRPDAITIEGLEVECIIGCYEHERGTTQRLVVDVTMAVEIELAALRDRLEDTVNYEWVSTQIAFVLKAGQFQLLETAAQTICRTLLLPPVDGEARGAIEVVELSLRKPNALGGRGVPSLRVRRTASEFQPAQESKPFGAVDVIHETSEVGFYRLKVFPGRSIEMHVHRRMSEAELVLSNGLMCQGALAAPGSIRQWPHGLAHHYENPTDRTQSLLCVNHPPFIEADEIPVGENPGAIAARTVWEI